MFNSIYDVLGVHKQTILTCAVIIWFWLTMLTRTMTHLSCFSNLQLEHCRFECDVISGSEILTSGVNVMHHK